MDIFQELLKDPTCKWPKEDLKHLVIDYTQFDEWSSDEEGLDAMAGIEAGYEHWQDCDDDELEEEMDLGKETKKKAAVGESANDNALTSKIPS